MASPDEFAALLAKNQQLLIAAAEQILSGNVKLQPYRKIIGNQQETGLDYSAYADIFRFDNVLDQRLYKLLETDKDKLRDQLKKQPKEGD